MSKGNYYVYIMTNVRHTVLYTGVTNHLARRISEHKSHIIPGFTKRYNVDILIYYEYFTQIEDALAREKQIKRWRREKKIHLIESTNPTWEEIQFGE